MSHRLPAFGLAALSVVALVTGCAPQAEPTPTPTPRFTSQAQAYQAAEATYRAYVDALNKVDLSDPATFEAVYNLATGERKAADTKALSNYYSMHAAMTGETRITVLEPRQLGANDETAVLDACVDVSDVDVRDASGASLISANRPDIQSVAVELNAADSAPTGYLVAAISGRSGRPQC